MNLEDISIVLAGARDSGNIGAVCRAMKNMGLSSLKLVLPSGVSGAGEGGKAGIINEEIIRARAVHAADIWESAGIFGSLQDAVLDSSIVIGTTRRRGKNRKGISLTPCECAAFLKNYPGGKAALVFGNERTGLETDELSLCNISSHINANPAFPSLNLSHSVQIYCYELFNIMSGEARTPQKGNMQPVDRAALDLLTASICKSLESAGFYTHSRERGREQHKQFFRDIFARAGLTAFESGHIGEIFSKISRLCSKS